MKHLFVILAAILGCGAFFQGTPINADDVFRIEVGRGYEGYSVDELRRRVWQLERAVNQLQAKVFQLEAQDHGPVIINGARDWTCHMQSFGRTLIASGNTRASALAQVLQKCSDATNAVHCHESDVRCDNE